MRTGFGVLFGSIALTIFVATILPIASGWVSWFPRYRFHRNKAPKVPRHHHERSLFASDIQSALSILPDEEFRDVQKSIDDYEIYPSRQKIKDYDFVSSEEKISKETNQLRQRLKNFHIVRFVQSKILDPAGFIAGATFVPYRRRIKRPSHGRRRSRSSFSPFSRLFSRFKH